MWQIAVRQERKKQQRSKAQHKAWQFWNKHKQIGVDIEKRSSESEK
ncbi:MAG: hypothetical protein LBL77_02835 [Endomicrobium sp.]|jgi:hypothetical protein|nr:hypothetical protein [Endomicrobium sp.]